MRVYREKLATNKGMKHAKDALLKRVSIPRKKIDQSMNFLRELDIPCTYYYCIICGAVSDVLNFKHTVKPRSFCQECESLQKSGANIGEILASADKELTKDV